MIETDVSGCHSVEAMILSVSPDDVSDIIQSLLSAAC